MSKLPTAGGENGSELASKETWEWRREEDGLVFGLAHKRDLSPSASASLQVGITVTSEAPGGLPISAWGRRERRLRAALLLTAHIYLPSIVFLLPRGWTAAV